MPSRFWQIYIQHLHPSMKSINYGTPYREEEDNSCRGARKREGKRKKRRTLLIRDEENRVESDNMQRDETKCVLDVGMKKRRGGIKGCSPL